MRTTKSLLTDEMLIAESKLRILDKAYCIDMAKQYGVLPKSIRNRITKLKVRDNFRITEHQTKLQDGGILYIPVSILQNIGLVAGDEIKFNLVDNILIVRKSE